MTRSAKAKASQASRQEGYVPSASVFRDHDRAQYSYLRASDAEFSRRWTKIRAFMDEESLDVLLIAGGTGTWDRNWTNTRWAVNHVGCQLTNSTYVVFPREGDITVLDFPLVAWLPARRAREIVEDVRATPEPHVGVIERVRELKQTRGCIGIVETDLNTSIPSKHMDAFRAEFGATRLRSVTREWWRKLRTVRSEEEIASMERAAMIGDAMSEAVTGKIRPGMPEQAIFGVLYEAMAREGGETPTMVLVASGSTLVACDIFQRERHMNRVLCRGDAIVTELSPRCADGSEIQTGRAYVLGGTTPVYERIGEMMLELYARVVDQLQPGKTDLDVLAAAQFVKDAGYTWLSPLVHGPEGGGTGALPIIASSVRQAEAEPFAFKPNMAMVVQAHVGMNDNSAGLFMADTWVTTDGPARPLNRYRREVIRI